MQSNSILTESPHAKETARDMMIAPSVLLTADMTVAEAMQQIPSSIGQDSVALYVTDHCGHLLGSVGCYALRSAPPHCLIEAMTEAVTVKIPTIADRETVVRAFTESGALVLPVVSEDEQIGRAHV